MSENNSAQISCSDPLAEVTRKERRMLLFASVVSVLIAKAGLIPKKIPALGIEFNSTNQEEFLVVLALVIVYFIVAFVVYGISDFFVWRTKYFLTSISEIKKDLSEAMPSNNEFNSRTVESEKGKVIIELHRESLRGMDRFIDPIAIARLFFEFALPVFFGVYAIFQLLAIIYK